jgi:ATP-dependent Zn protease
MAKPITIIILTTFIFCLPAQAFGFFATQDNTIHSMNFDIQKNAKIIPTTPPTGIYINGQDSITQNKSPENLANTDNSEPVENNQPATNKNSSSSAIWLWVMWIIIISTVVAIFVFLLKKL